MIFAFGINSASTTIIVRICRLEQHGYKGWAIRKRQTHPHVGYNGLLKPFQVAAGMRSMVWQFLPVHPASQAQTPLTQEPSKTQSKSERHPPFRFLMYCARAPGSNLEHKTRPNRSARAMDRLCNMSTGKKARGRGRRGKESCGGERTTLISLFCRSGFLPAGHL